MCSKTSSDRITSTVSTGRSAALASPTRNRSGRIVSCQPRSAKLAAEHSTRTPIPEDVASERLDRALQSVAPEHTHPLVRRTTQDWRLNVNSDRVHAHGMQRQQPNRTRPVPDLENAGSRQLDACEPRAQLRVFREIAKLQRVARMWARVELPFRSVALYASLSAREIEAVDGDCFTPMRPRQVRPLSRQRPQRGRFRSASTKPSCVKWRCAYSSAAAALSAPRPPARRASPRASPGTLSGRELSTTHPAPDSSTMRGDLALGVHRREHRQPVGHEVHELRRDVELGALVLLADEARSTAPRARPRARRRRRRRASRRGRTGSSRARRRRRRRCR